MKNYQKAIIIIITALLLGTICIVAGAQTKVITDKQGNYTAVVKTGAKQGGKATATGRTFTDAKGKTYPVYESKNGKLFIIRTSAKTGKNYNQYLQQ